MLSSAYYNHISQSQLVKLTILKQPVIVIIRLMLSLLVCPKVVTLSGFYCIAILWIDSPTITKFVQKLNFKLLQWLITIIQSETLIIQVFNETHSIPQPIPISHPRPSLCAWIHFRHHHDQVTTTPEQNHIYVQIYNHVIAIVSSLINLI